jgi:hypothetical protein
LKDLENRRKEVSSDNQELQKLIRLNMGKAYYLLGINFYHTEEQSRGENVLLKSVYILSKKTEDAPIINTSQSDIQVKEEEKGADKNEVNESVQKLETSVENDMDQEMEKLNVDDGRQPEDNEKIPAFIDKREFLVNDVIKYTQTEVEDGNSVYYLADAYNYVAMIWYNRSEYNAAETLFKRSEQIYHYFKEQRDEFEHLIHRMEDIHTLTTFYLAQVYGVLKNQVLSAKYCFLTLKRQYNTKMEFNTREWATNCLTLNAFFLSYNDFEQSYHFIKAAQYVLDKEFEEKGSNDEEFQRCMANQHLAVARFNHELLKYSKNWLGEHDSDRANRKFILLIIIIILITSIS